jgi:CheY-like chemotaxis protein
MSYKFENASVLVVDDMPPMLALTKSLLQIFGFKTIYSATDADRAFEIFCKERPDLVVTDWQMEPYDGIELIRRIRRDPLSPNPYAPIILMTGYSAKMRVMEARDHGVTEFLSKPFTATDLYNRIEQIIEKPRKFVDSGDFFGPDRRRRRIKEYNGPFRRDVDESGNANTPKKVQDDLKRITEELRKKHSD